MGGLLVAVIILAALLFLNTGGNSGKADTVLNPTPQPTLPPAQAATKSLFGDDGKGIYRPAIYNSMNSTATEYLSATMRVYKLVNNVEVFYGTVVTQTGGIQASGTGTLSIEGYDSTGNLQKYVAYVPATDGTITSARYTFDAAEDVAAEYPVPKQATLLFKVYDNENRGYVGETSELTAAYGGLVATGRTFFSTTSNSSGYAVGAGGLVDYKIYFETNGTASTATQFEDQIFIVGVDAQDLSDYDEPSLTMDGAVVTKLNPGEYNDKIKNLGYDYIYKITVNGKPLHVASTFKKLDIQVNAKGSVDPTDDIKVGFFTGGYFKQTVGSAMLMDTHKDDSAQTGVFTVQDVTLSIA